MLGFAPNVKTPDGLLFVKLKFVLLPNWKTEPTIVEAKKKKKHIKVKMGVSVNDPDPLVQSIVNG